MSKRLAVLAVLACVSAASACILTMTWFDWTDGIGDKDGYAFARYAPRLDLTKFHIWVTGFEPNTSYGVNIGGGFLIAPPEAGLQTNDCGAGYVMLSNPGDITGLAPFTLEIFDGTGAVVARGTIQ